MKSATFVDSILKTDLFLVRMDLEWTNVMLTPNIINLFRGTFIVTYFSMNECKMEFNKYLMQSAVGKYIGRYLFSSTDY